LYLIQIYVIFSVDIPMCLIHNVYYVTYLCETVQWFPQYYGIYIQHSLKWIQLQKISPYHAYRTQIHVCLVLTTWRLLRKVPLSNSTVPRRVQDMNFNTQWIKSSHVFLCEFMNPLMSLACSLASVRQQYIHDNHSSRGKWERENR
jgi:hypothetical protein